MIITKILAVITIISIVSISGISQETKEEDCIHPDETVYFHIQNTTFNVTGNLPFSQIILTSQYIQFNNTRFYTSPPNTNITLAQLSPSLLSFYTNNLTYFNITGFLPANQYSIHKNTTLYTEITSNPDGNLSFHISDSSKRFIEITPTIPIPGDDDDDDSTGGADDKIISPTKRNILGSTTCRIMFFCIVIFAILAVITTSKIHKRPIKKPIKKLTRKFIPYSKNKEIRKTQIARKKEITKLKKDGKIGRKP